MERAKRLAMFNDDDDDDGPSFQSKPLDQQKLSQFTAHTVRKSKREKEAEAAEAKRREEEEHAAKAYADFLDAFDAPSGSNTGAGFVRSSASAGDTLKVYKPLVTSSRASRRHEVDEVATASTSAPKPKGKRAMDSFLEEIKREQAEREERHKRTNVTHSSATAMAAFETQRGSRDTGDPETTNIFVANLPQNVTEDTLGHFFARNGPVGSVKIMWPRGDNTSGVGGDITSTRKSRSAGLSGFVQFMKRKDAENCVREMDGFDWGGSVLRVGWSKAVPLAPRAQYERTRSRSPPKEERRHRARRSQSYSRSRSRSRSPRRNRDSRRPKDRHSDRDRERERDMDYGRRRDSRSRSYSRSRSPDLHHHSRHHSSRYDDHGRGRRLSYSRSPSRHRRRSYSRSRSRDRRDIDYETRVFIRTVAQDCKNHGKEYEETLRGREKGNPKYSFMWKNSAPGYEYFKSLRSEAIKPTTEFDDNGSQTAWSTDSAEESEKERTVRKEILGKLAKKKLEALLRRQTGRREDMALTMVFCIDHAHAAPQIADTIIASLLVDTTAVPRKVARLHLICDILHNSAISVHKAWKFRQEFQARLPLVFDHLGTIYQSFPGRMTAEIFKKQIFSVVEVWEDWLVFPPEFTQELRTRLEGDVEASPQEQDMSQIAEEEMPSQGAAKESSKFKSSSFKPATEPEDGDGTRAAEPGDIEGVAMDDIDGEPVDGEDLDGMPLDEDVHELDGESLDGEPLDGEPLDGDPLGGEALDGETLDTDPLETKLAAPRDNAERQGENSDVSMEMDDDSD